MWSTPSCRRWEEEGWCHLQSVHHGLTQPHVACRYMYNHRSAAAACSSSTLSHHTSHAPHPTHCTVFDYRSLMATSAAADEQTNKCWLPWCRSQLPSPQRHRLCVTRIHLYGFALTRCKTKRQDKQRGDTLSFKRGDEHQCLAFWSIIPRSARID